MTFVELAEKTAKVLGVPVTYTPGPAMGVPLVDDTFAVMVELNGLYTDTPIPNPELVALGAKFSTVEEFLELEVKTLYGQ